MMAGEGAAGKSATLWDEAWLGAETEIEPVAGRRTGDGTETGTDALVGHALGSGAGTELEAGADDETGVMSGAAAAFCEFSCPKTGADIGTKAGRWAGRNRGWFGLEALPVSFSKGVQMTLFIGTGDSLVDETKTGAGTGTDPAKEWGTGAFAEAGTRTAIAFSIRLCTLEGSMTCWLSSGGGVGPFSPL